ncbi:MAG: hypothetical protein HYR94_26435 [Chloroflexi bacterium]|nr:hypothetical protein [Chloroflexota bacterium]
MRNSKLLLPFLFSLFLSLVIIVINFHIPTEAHAGPLAGFTPTPQGNSPDNDNDNSSSDSPSKDEAPPDYVLVEIDRCNLHCGVTSAQTDDQPGFQPLASVGVSDGAPLLFTPAAKPQALPELLLPVQLVHDGSGFIVEGELSDTKPTRFSVPYPGHWQVWVTGSPHFMTAEAIDVSGSNMADLQSQLANGPVSLGLVEANTSEPQLVKCPLACVVDTPPAVETPPLLPETGGLLAIKINYPAFLITGGVTLSLIGLILWTVYRYPAKNHRS